MGDGELMPKSRNDLKRILTEYGIDSSSWGTAGLKSVDDLFDEIMNAKCLLKCVRVDGGGYSLERVVHIVSVKLQAETTQGIRWLKTTGAYDFRTGSVMYSARDCSRKVNLFADAESEVRQLL